MGTANLAIVVKNLPIKIITLQVEGGFQAIVLDSKKNSVAITEACKDPAKYRQDETATDALDRLLQLTSKMALDKLRSDGNTLVVPKELKFEGLPRIQVYSAADLLESTTTTHRLDLLSMADRLGVALREDHLVALLLTLATVGREPSVAVGVAASVVAAAPRDHQEKTALEGRLGAISLRALHRAVLEKSHVRMKFSHRAKIWKNMRRSVLLCCLYLKALSRVQPRNTSRIN